MFTDLVKLFKENGQAVWLIIISIITLVIVQIITMSITAVFTDSNTNQESPTTTASATMVYDSVCDSTLDEAAARKLGMLIRTVSVLGRKITSDELDTVQDGETVLVDTNLGTVILPYEYIARHRETLVEMLKIAETATPPPAGNVFVEDKYVIGNDKLLYVDGLSLIRQRFNYPSCGLTMDIGVILDSKDLGLSTTN